MSYKAKIFIKTITVTLLMFNSSCASYLGSTKKLAKITESMDNGINSHEVNLMNINRYPIYRNRVDLYNQGNIKIIDIDFSNGFINAKLFRSQVFRADEVFITETSATLGAYSAMYLYAFIIDALVFTIPVFFGYVYFDNLLHQQLKKDYNVEQSFGNIAIITGGLIATDLACGTYFLSQPTISETRPVTKNFFDKKNYALPSSKIILSLSNKEYPFTTDKNSLFSLPINTITLGKNNAEIINIFDKDRLKFKKSSFNLADSIDETTIRAKWEKYQDLLKTFVTKNTSSYNSNKNIDLNVLKKSGLSAFKKAGFVWVMDKAKKNLEGSDKMNSQQNNIEYVSLAISLTQSYLNNNNIRDMSKDVLEDELTSMLKKNLDIKDSKFLSSFIYYFVIEVVKELY